MVYLEANCRKDKTSTTEFSYNPILIHRGDGVPFGGKLKNVLVLVHGYGGTYEHVSNAYDTIENYVDHKKMNYDAVVRFYWPASWSKTIGFLLARRRVKEAKRHLFGYIVELVQNFRTERICIQAHSLGCMVVQSILTELSQEFCPTRTDISAVFCAPAITNEYYQKLGLKFPKLKIAFSNNDPVLHYAFRLAPGNWKSPAIGCRPDPSLKDMCEFHDFSDQVSSHTGYKYVWSYYDLLNLE